MFFFSGHDGKGYTGCPACGDSPSGPACEPAIASFVTEGLMERWTRVVLRFRWPILTGWLVVLLAGGFAFTHLSSLLSDRKSTRLNSSHLVISYAVFCLKKKS